GQPGRPAVRRSRQEDVASIRGGTARRAGAIVIREVELTGVCRIDYGLRERVRPETAVQGEAPIHPVRVQHFHVHRGPESEAQVGPLTHSNNVRGAAAGALVEPEYVYRMVGADCDKGHLHIERAGARNYSPARRAIRRSAVSGARELDGVPRAEIPPCDV